MAELGGRLRNFEENAEREREWGGAGRSGEWDASRGEQGASRDVEGIAWAACGGLCEASRGVQGGRRVHCTSN